MGYWLYRCLECRSQIAEAKLGSSRQLVSAICKACTRDIIMQNERLFCRDCSEKGTTVVAHRLIGKTPVCDAHYRERMGMPQLTKSVDTVIEKKEERKVDNEEKCFCGREKGHRGRHKGVKAANKIGETVTIKKPRREGSMDYVLQELKARRDKLTRAIEALEDV